MSTTDPAAWVHTSTGERVADGYSNHADRYRSTRWRDNCRTCDLPPSAATAAPITTTKETDR